MISARARLLLPLALSARAATPLPFRIRQETPLQHAGPDFCWFHPRVAAIPKAGKNGHPRVVMTLCQHLDADDHYSGLWYMYTDDLGVTWKGPFEVKHLAAQPEPGGLHSSVHDVTPGWHPHTRKLIAIGGRTFYNAQGKHISGDINKGGTAYATYDPKTDHWQPWSPLEFPNQPMFANCRSSCSQFLTKPDGSLLVPVYYQKVGTPYWAVTVLACTFDGTRLQYVRHGTLLEDNTKRGLAEPSIAFHRNRYYLTIRHDDRAYVATSPDGLTYEPMKPWRFDDGADLGSVNTQQHWVTHSKGLFLAYTSLRDDNRKLARGRAPLYIAQIDPEKLHVLRATEKILIPNRGLLLGNFGAAEISTSESWVTDAEFLWYSHGYKPTPQGGNGSVWVARVQWL
ncbi:MAG: exo-alpha-sialidase [Acidobacteria bacterium]|nr:exo-alpha-sialidase [Acidobacteriota bacterium]